LFTVRKDRQRVAVFFPSDAEFEADLTVSQPWHCPCCCDFRVDFSDRNKPVNNFLVFPLVSLDDKSLNRRNNSEVIRCIMKKLFAFALFAASLATPTFADTLAQWTFESSGLSGSTTLAPGAGVATTNFYAEGGLQAGSATAFGLHSASATYSSPSGNGSTKSLSANTWTVGDYWQIQLNTTGYSGLSLSYDQTGSGTGPRDFSLSYSLDGSSFTTIGSTYAVPLSTWNVGTSMTGFTQTYDLGSISAINDQSLVIFRVTDMDTTSINGSTVGTGGTDRIDNVMLFTTPVPEPSVAALCGLGVAALVFRLRKKVS
jgi:hypothetical protein